MSATSYTYCPHCTKTHLEKFNQLEEQTREAYGKIPSDEYIELAAKVKNGPEKIEKTVAEYYEAYMNEGVFRTDYACKCDICGWKFEYRFEKTVYPLEETK